MAAQDMTESQTETENLYQLDMTSGQPLPMKNLNAKLSRLEVNLAGLSKRLSTTDHRLRDLHSDSSLQKNQLTGRIDEAHAELQIIQASYEELARQSKKIAKDTESFSLETRQRFDELDSDHDQLLRRTDILEVRTEQLMESMESRLTAISSTIQALETGFTSELELVGKESELRDQALSDHISEVASTNAAALADLDRRVTGKMDALETGLKQANQDITTLFGTTFDLTEQSDDIQLQLNTVDSRVDSLTTRTEAVEDQNEQQGFDIARLFETGHRHLQWGIASALVLLLLLGTLFFVDTTRWNAATEASTTLATESVVHGADIELNREIVVEQQRLIDALQKQVETITDVSDSANGRITAMSPTRQFGGDNILHGPSWLAAQDAQSYVAVIATVYDKTVLYRIAEHWGHYLTEPLAYYQTLANNRPVFVLAYGTFADAATARSATQRIPSFDRTNPWARPIIKQMAEIQAAISF